MKDIEIIVNDQKHMKEKHQDIIASVTRKNKSKPKPEEELKIW